MIKYDELLAEAGYSAKAINEVREGKLHYGGSLDAASDKELSVKLAFHVDAKLENVAELFMRFPKKKEFDDSVIALGEDGYASSVYIRCAGSYFVLSFSAFHRNDCRRWWRWDT
jgi:hypothetical protein